MTQVIKIKKRKIERYIGGLSKLGFFKKSIKLSANESALGPSPKAHKAYMRDKSKVFKYPDSDSNALRNIISKQFKLNQNRIICGNGSDQIFDLVCKVFLKPGDEVIVPKFGFIMHRIYASTYKAKVIFAKENNFKISVNEILKKVSKKTKIVFIANPNNPTGTYLKKNEIITLRKKLNSSILLVIDDAYFEFMKQKDFSSGLDLFSNYPNVLITRTFSKIYGLAGLRIGWGYSSKAIIREMYKVKPPFNVNRAAQAASIEAIKDKKWLKKSIKHNTIWAKKIFLALKKYNIKSNEPTANFFLMNFDKTKINSKLVFKKLASKGLILREMNQYKIPNSLRLTVGSVKENEKLIKYIKRIFK